MNERFELHHLDRSLLRELITAMSATSDAINAQTAAIADLTTAVAAVPVGGTNPDDAANAAAIEANTTAVQQATATLTSDEAPPAPPAPAPVPEAPVDENPTPNPNPPEGA